MDRVNIRTYIPQLLNEWRVPEFSERSIVRLRAIKGGRRTGILKGTHTAEGNVTWYVAIKIVNTDYSAQSSDPKKRLKLLIEYFKRECRIWRALGDHPNIAPLLGFVRPLQMEAFPALIMPYYEGRNLRMFVSQYKISLKGKVKLMRDVASGLKHMHSFNPPAIHRDIKASNIVIEILDGTRYNARIADFGSTKLAEVETDIQVTGGTSAPVTFSWTPPEYVKVSSWTKKPMIDYTHPTTAGDIWSFGCTFLEVLRSANPWDGYAIEKELLERKHPPKPENCLVDDNCWNVMLVCWFADPVKRHGASQLIKHLLAIERLLE